MALFITGVLKVVKAVSKYLHAPSPYRLDNSVLNALGIQILRTVYASLRYFKLRGYGSHHNAVYKKKLDQDGIVVIEDFLPQNFFDDCLGESDRSRGNSHKEGVAFSEGGCDNWAIVFNDSSSLFSKTNAALRKSPLILDLVSHICKKKVDRYPDTMSYLYQRLSPGAKFAQDGTTFLHADAHYPTCKVVLYMSDVSDDDAPFLYCKGSHRLTYKRLFLEHNLAKRIGKLAKNRLSRRVPELGASQMKALNLKPTPIKAKKNTLIIANHMGFHARGAFAGKGERMTLRLSFRFVDAPRYRYRRILDPTYSYFKSFFKTF